MRALILSHPEGIAAALATAALALLTAAHAVLYKRDSKVTAAWLGLIFFAPLAGPVLYWVFGINRIRRTASELRRRPGHARLTANAYGPRAADPAEFLWHQARHLSRLVHTVDRVVAWPLVAGNRVEALVNGDQAYPAMLRAIEGARGSITLGTYIFNDDPAGRLFVGALTRAVARGVAVRVLVDAVGARYSFPPIIGKLKRAGVPVARFMPVAAPWRMPFWNLRDHRKTLIVDGRLAFTGGMNIAAGNLLASHPKRPIQDLQFEVEGPVVAHIQEVFAEDWFFTAKEDLRGELWFPALKPAGGVHARGVPDGPDADYEKLLWTILGAIAAARTSIRILTPYFLPDTALIAALNTAALSGVQVDIVLSGADNLPYVQWACEAQLWQVLQHGCNVWLTPAPFDHSKLILVDGAWSFIGSANWDPRSLRLNFEFNLECYDAALAAALDKIVEEKRQAGRKLSLADVDARGLPVRLRDGVARLFSPYL